MTDALDQGVSMDAQVWRPLPSAEREQPAFFGFAIVITALALVVHQAGGLTQAVANPVVLWILRSRAHRILRPLTGGRLLPGRRTGRPVSLPACTRWRAATW